ncbi:hypothetical protein DM860_004602 [Cuscuta australis]|uniref:Peptidase A1 domain-containing protein n=1 Tax=Cuscuta australis TaxID=267555 RepID=A0A328ECA8_9ASTE|nr:hypothetical protein DM860_004602 [Cuscuta australis]
MATATLWSVFCLMSLIVVVSQSTSIVYEYNVFHRYSSEVTSVLGDKGLPKQGTVEYYAAWKAHDQHRNRLHGEHRLPALTFAGGDVTTQIQNLGRLHYAQIRVGTPPVSFMVVLDTGSVISWLPCHCVDCAQDFETDSGEVRNLHSYTPESSSTSANVSCDSPQCWPKMQCTSEARTACPYEVTYESYDTMTKGYLVTDVLRLETYDNGHHAIDTPVIFGCGVVETGANLYGGAINGLLGLGVAYDLPLDVPRILASKGLVPNAFSLCFASDGRGRIAFGDKGTKDQMKTPLHTTLDNGGYNIMVQQIAVGNVVTDVDFVAMVDSGTTYTYLNAHAYAFITENFNSRVKEPRVILMNKDSFEYCYSVRNDTTNWAPSLKLKMKGGAEYHVRIPTVTAFSQTNELVHCLGIHQNNNLSVNTIGQNFMMGYHLVFDREEPILGWKPSNCIAKEANTMSSSKAELPSKGERLELFLVFLLTFSIATIMSNVHFRCDCIFIRSNKLVSEPNLGTLYQFAGPDQRQQQVCSSRLESVLSAAAAHELSRTEFIPAPPLLGDVAADRGHPSNLHRSDLSRRP